MADRASRTLRAYKGGVLAVTKYGHAKLNTWTEMLSQKPKPALAVRLPPGEGPEGRQGRAQAARCSYAERYRAMQDDAAARSGLLKEAIAQENEYRRTFAQDRQNATLDDPYATLIPVANYSDIFSCLPPSVVPRVFALGEKGKLPGEASIVAPDRFRRNFELFTEGLLQHLNWDNVFVAGGSVLACLQPVPPKYASSNHLTREYYHDEAYKSSDIDLFIYGLDEDAAKEKLQEIFHSICERTMPLAPTIAFRSTNAISVVSQYPFRHVQIITRLYKSPAEVLMGFDVDSCSVGYDGTTVWMTPRCHHALVAQANTVDMSRRSPTYETRLAKYASRGFSVEVPALQREYVDPQIFERRFDSVKGLAKLLLFERLSTPEARAAFKEEQRRKQLRPVFEKQGKYMNVIMHEFAHDSYLVERLEEQPKAASDYSTVFLPWGPKWDAGKIRKLMYTKDVMLNLEAGQAGGVQRHKHPCFFGSMEEVLQDCCGQCPNLGDLQPADAADYVSGPLKFMTVNPGQQAIGSFHPITEGDWMEGAFVNEGTESLVLAVASRDSAKLQAALALPTVSVNAKDVTGRSPLVIAAFVGNVEATQELLNRGARLCDKTPDGRVALHIAAAHGHAAIIELLIERGREVNATLERELRTERQAEIERRKADAAEDGDGPRDSDFWRRRYLRKIAREKEEARRRAEAEERRSLDRLDIDQKDTDWLMTPLMYAVFFGHVECARILIKNGANVDQQLVYEANGSPTASYTLLQLAAFGRHLSTVRLLLEEGTLINATDVKGRTVLHTSAQLLRRDVIEVLVLWKGTRRANRRPSPFPGQSEAWQLAMSKPAFNQSNATPEEFAAALEQLEAKKTEFEVNVIDINRLDNDQKTALATVISNWSQFRERGWLDGARATVVALLEGGAHLQLVLGAWPSGQPPSLLQPVHLAASTGEPEALELLIAKGADVNALHQTGRHRGGINTPLDLVMQRIEDLGKPQDVPHRARASVFEYLQFLLDKAETGSYEAYALRSLLNREKLNPATTQEDTDVEMEARKQEKKRLEHCQRLLLAANAKRFVQLTFSENDPQGYRSLQENARKQRNMGTSSVAFRLGFVENHCSSVRGTTFEETFEVLDQKGSTTRVSPRLQEKYRDLFDAVVRGDVPRIRALCEPPVVPEDQVFVTARSRLLGMTTLQVAMDCNLPAAARELVCLAAKQYAPPKPTADEPTRGARRIDNLQLAAAAQAGTPLATMMESLQLASIPMFGPQRGPKTDTAAVEDAFCCQSPADFVKYGPWFTAVSLAVGEGKVAALRALFDVVQELHLMTGPHETERLLCHLLRSRCGNGTPFEIAMQFDQVEAAKLLLERGAMDCFDIDVNALLASGDGTYEGLTVGGQRAESHLPHHLRLSRDFRRRHHMTGLHVAAKSRSRRCIEFLLGTDSVGYLVLDPTGAVDNDSACGDPLFTLWQRDAAGRTALHEAVERGDIDTLKCLLAAGTKAMGAAAVKQVIDICSTLPREDGSCGVVVPVLVEATDALQLEAMAALLQAGADPSLACREGQPPLCAAAAKCFLAGVLLLLEHKAIVRVGNRRGWTSVHLAAIADTSTLPKAQRSKVGSPTECLAALLKADHTAVDVPSAIGETPLMLAAQYGRADTLELLLASKANALLKDDSGKTAIHHAARGPSEACLKLLIAHSVPVNVEDSEARTPGDWCMIAVERSLASQQPCEYPAFQRLQAAVAGQPRELVSAAQFRAHILKGADATGQAQQKPSADAPPQADSDRCSGDSEEDEEEEEEEC
eukprot:GGOE01058684.1.p1 GENE.GGOE01058684.1~~GGOE01058684.1.p1  ORF type:complete len:1789 (-),score=486.60 GGOE01058684.1:265-5601(-)